MNFSSLKKVSTFDVFKISLPMMISSLSSHLMLVMDQLILANFSIEAMTGASSASVWCSALQCAAMSITMVAGAFAGNYNGAKKYSLAGVPVWQMIWFAIALFAISIPLSYTVGQYCVPTHLQEYGLPYFRILMFCTPITGVYYALSAFFVSIGKGKVVTFSVIFSNVVNFAADIVLVFGFFGIESFKGSVGAAIGTVLAWLTNVSILFTLFLRYDIRTKYSTFDFRLRFPILKQCLKLGIAGGVGHIFEMLAWSILYYMLADLGKEIAMIQSIAVSVNIMLAFVVSGLEKGMMAITANLLGAKLKHLISSAMSKGLVIHIVFCSALSFLFFFFPEVITDIFVKFEVSQEVLDSTHFVLRLVWTYFLLDGFCWVVAGVIEAGGDINYTMLTIAFYLWIIAAIPVIILHHFDMLNVKVTWSLLIMAVACISSTLYHRYRTDKWIHIKV